MLHFGETQSTLAEFRIVISHHKPPLFRHARRAAIEADANRSRNGQLRELRLTQSNKKRALHTPQLAKDLSQTLQEPMYSPLRHCPSATNHTIRCHFLQF